MHGVIAKQFALDLSQKLSTLYYTDNTAPYFCAELVSVWKIPSDNREHFAGKSQRQGRCEKLPAFVCTSGRASSARSQQARILYGDKQDALAQISAAVEKYPLIATLVIPGDQVSEARIKVKTPGNLLYVNYHKLADRRKKEE